MTWQDQINGETLSWLLDPGDPGVRYLALRDLLDDDQTNPSLLAAQTAAHHTGPIAEVLQAMDVAGYWVQPGAGYHPKYRGTVWSIIMLSQLGASVTCDDRIERACRYLLDHALTEYGQFSTSGSPGSTIDCLQGNLCGAMLDLGFDDPRLEKAFDWMARTVTGEGIALMGDQSTPIRYYSGKCGPNFVCGANKAVLCLGCR
jgi:hypothetical protein